MMPGDNISEEHAASIFRVLQSILKMEKICQYQFTKLNAITSLKTVILFFTQVRISNYTFYGFVLKVYSDVYFERLKEIKPIPG